MKVFDIDELLDIDELTPGQQRQVRRLCKYQLTYDHGQIEVLYQYKNSIHTKREQHGFFVTDKTSAYKRIMENMIYNYCQSLEFHPHGKEIQKLIDTDPWRNKRTSERYELRLTFINEDQVIDLTDWREITAQTLFQIFKIVFKL